MHALRAASSRHVRCILKPSSMVTQIHFLSLNPCHGVAAWAIRSTTVGNLFRKMRLLRGLGAWVFCCACCATPRPAVQFLPQTQAVFYGSHAIPEPARQRQLDKTYCLVDEDGRPKPFSSVSQISGRNYESMISCMIGSGGSRTLRANLFQDPKEQHRLKTCKDAVARFLRETVSE